MNEAYYRHHVFFCVNRRDDGAHCCAGCGAQPMRDYAKQRIKTLELNGQGAVRVNNAGCLNRCEEGPVMVIYPEGVWYTYVDQTDIDEIIERHLIRNDIVDRLRI